MRYVFRELAYLFIMAVHKIKNRCLQVEFRAKAEKGSRFEGYNKLSHHAYFSGELGYASYIGANSVVIGKIGRFCSIAENVHFLTLTHPVRGFVSTHPSFYSLKKQSGFTFAKSQMFDETPKLEGDEYSIVVGNDVYIGYGATIIGPCRIGDGAVIAAGAVVTKDVEPYAIVGGVPATTIKFRFDQEMIERLLETKWWSKDTDWIRKNSASFVSVDKFLAQRGEELYYE